ncbi:hypothetical protein EV702DRAFT_1269134 [Suillus placidus]|uniref:Hydrophobin n=1 Tax=Suillus placidus TaxID=48579 RepID=A0A9P7D0W7_9AGAM|nr:hypothetical protein EV702DRAFT_1269134 [Suillus placidus]
MFIRASVVFAILLLVSQATVKATTNLTGNCGQGTARCCETDSSDPGNVNDEQCKSYSEPCASGYVAACCYTIYAVHRRSDLATGLLLLQPDWVRLTAGSL